MVGVYDRKSFELRMLSRMSLVTKPKKISKNTRKVNAIEKELSWLSDAKLVTQGVEFWQTESDKSLPSKNKLGSTPNILMGLTILTLRNNDQSKRSRDSNKRRSLTIMGANTLSYLNQRAYSSPKISSYDY